MIYHGRLEERRRAVALLDQQHIRVGNLRLCVAIAAAAMAWMVFAWKSLALWCLLLPIAAFIALAAWHERILQRSSAAKRAVSFYERGIARIEDRWAGTGETGEAYKDDGHVYADDLDLFGKAGVFELLCAARTRGGEQKLAHWLKNPAPAPVIRQRQQAVTELRGLLDLRESLFVLGENAKGKLDSEGLVNWAESPTVLKPGPILIAATVITAISIACGIAWAWTGLRFPFLAAALIASVLGYNLRALVSSVLAHLEQAVHEIALLEGMLLRLESQSFESASLRALSESLRGNGALPSADIGRLHRLAELADSRDNVTIRVLDAPLLYSTHLAFAVERWRTRSGPHVRKWLEAVSDIEALLSLAGYSFEHPADPFPELIDAPVVEGEDLGHPLLPSAQCVQNSVHLDATTPLLLVSGSNMSGKSTYLRTIGTNVVLALAGAPVRAKRLKLCPVSLGASIRVTDSLQGGASRFYAEITRLKHIVDLTRGGPPVLFLLDEFLHGTNSHDRRIGAEGVLKELIARKSMGLVTTHDLALTQVAGELAAKLHNVHFEDHLEAGKLRFDYRLREGVVTKSNALELMRSIGLEV